MKKENKRRSFLKTLTIGSVGVAVTPGDILSTQAPGADGKEAAKPSTAEAGGPSGEKRPYNSTYKGEYLNRVAFPIGGIGAGMFCLEGTGAISHMSVRNRPEIYHEPVLFAALAIKENAGGGGEVATKARILEGPVPARKYFGQSGTGNGAAGTTFGLPRFGRSEFKTAFPFAEVSLHDDTLPVEARITGWSPFIPTNEDSSSLPVGALEYTFLNKGKSRIEAVFSYSAKNFLATANEVMNRIGEVPNGFLLHQEGSKDRPHLEGSFAIFTDDTSTIVDHCWFRGGWWDPLTMAWNTIRDGKTRATAPADSKAPGATLFVPFSLEAGARKTIRVMMAWYVPESSLHGGEAVESDKKGCDPQSGCCSGPGDLGVPAGKKSSSPNYKPWYSGVFGNAREVVDHWRTHYDQLHKDTRSFKDAFYASTLPPEVMEAVAANLTIIRSPTVLRQYDGRLWSWEGCGDEEGCCEGSCTHVWNYAQAIPHLFPSLERSLRNTEFCENQNKEGHQGFRANLPISPLKHDFHAAADGQLGGIMKVYRDWRISGDGGWLSRIYPAVQKSLDYCIHQWDPRGKGVVEEPHHNTYDIEFWGPEGMCTSFYLGALTAITQMGEYLQKDVSIYRALYEKGRAYMQTKLFNGDYFFQDIVYKGLNAPDPAKAKSYGGEYSPEAVALLQREGPKYQYGTGCLSDGVLGSWIGQMCGLGNFIDPEKVRSHLASVHQYNLRKDLSEHANPQRPAYALGHEGGLLLCTWPKGGKLSLPFVYSDEVWTGIEYQVASHLMLMGHVREGLEIVRYCRDRYDGRVRNPFNEYECGHWYARAMSSYGLIQGLTGIRYDAVDRRLYVDSRIGDFTAFISTATGFGTVHLQAGKVDVKVAYGEIAVDQIMVSGKEMKG